MCIYRLDLEIVQNCSLICIEIIVIPLAACPENANLKITQKSTKMKFKIL